MKVSSERAYSLPKLRRCNPSNPGRCKMSPDDADQLDDSIADVIAYLLGDDDEQPQAAPEVAEVQS